MEEKCISRSECEARIARLDAENDRQNHRLKKLEDQQAAIQQLSVSVEKLAQNMQNMLREQEEQGKRLSMLESRDGEMWRKVMLHVVTCAVGLVIGYVFKSIGM